MENVLIEINNFNKHCDELYKQYVEHKSRHCDKYWLDKYKKNFDDAILIKQKIEKMASIIKETTKIVSQIIHIHCSIFILLSPLRLQDGPHFHCIWLDI